MNRKLIFLVLALSTFSFGMNGQKITSYSHPIILKEKDFNLKKALTPPPKKGSAEEKADFTTLHQLQEKRTSEDCAKGNHVVQINLNTYFGKPDGFLTESEVNALDPLFDKVRRDVGYFTGLAKKHFNRPRPYVADKSLNPCAEKPDNAAYPSGHTTIAYVFAGLLSKWDTSRSELIMKRANEISDGRVTVGVHHPSDIEGGKKLAKYLLSKYWKSSQFMKEFKALPKPGSIH